ncbi:hypothetical protein QBC36DRAFT_382766 [Triangularia setosa]|uniref:DUF7600 domain-containing protein n=1 Tax=Triangularia setosa TaxID=2587417 RepID=A0AAN6VYN7_9PEZI|nr:hypothetical protein QBC36DRAFT_382766 [Podospora setosa]
MNEFRGLYLYSTDEKITLTGVGLYSDPGGGVFIAPPNPASRYDNDGYTISEHDQFGNWRYAVNNRRGFPMHDACWKLLEEALYPDPVPINRLFDVLDSLTNAMYGKLDWGYKECFSPADCAVKQSFPWEGVAHDRQARAPPFSSDPFSVDVDQILSQRFETCEVPIPPANISSGPMSRNDPFLSLPEELCTAIASYLPTHDALHARLASRSGHPDSWVGTQTSHGYLKFAGIPTKVVPKLGFNLRVGGTAAEHPDMWSPLEPGCRRRYKQHLPIPQESARISASTIVAGSFTYIAGLSTVSNSHTVKVGYIGPKEKERSIEQNGAELRGFNVGVGLRGIHALQFADSEGSTPWLGDPDDAAITTRLGNVSDIAALEIWSDGFKLVGIAIVTNRGRRYQFEDEPKPRNWNVKTKLFTAPPGYIITGFYGAQFQGLVALGVITELEP